MNSMPYQIFRGSELVMQSTENCRYPKEVERSLMAAGYIIRLHGKRITKKETEK